MGLRNLIKRVSSGGAEKRSLWDVSPYAVIQGMMTSLAGVGTTAGQPVNEGTAMSLVSVFAAVRNISDDIGKMQKGVFRLLPRGKVQIYDHPMHRILCQSPNPEMTCFVFIRTLIMSALVFGNGFAEIIRDRYTGKPIHVYPLYPMRVRLYRETSGPNLGLLYYMIDGSRRVEYDDMIKVSNLNGCTGLLGIPTIRSVKSSLGVAIALEEFAASYFGNGQQLKGYFSADGEMSLEAREKFLRDWMKNYGGATQAHQNAFLPPGFKWNALSSPNNEGQFLESRQFQIIDIARLFRIPPHKLMDLTRGTFANVEQQNSEYLQDCLLSWVVQLEEEFKSKLTKDHEVDIIPKFKMASFLRGDMQARTAYYLAGISWGYFSRNDVREMEDLNPIDGLDTFLVPQNFSAASALETMTKSQLTLLALHAKQNGVALDENGIPTLLGKQDDGAGTNDDQADPVDQIIPEKNVPPPPGIVLPGIMPVDDAYSFGYGFGSRSLKPLLTDAYQRVLRVESDKVLRAVKKGGNTEEFYKSHGEYVRSAITPVVTALADLAWAAQKKTPTDEERGQLAKHIEGMVQRHIRSSQADLVDPDGLVQRVENWDARVEQIVTDELSQLMPVLIPTA